MNSLSILLNAILLFLLLLAFGATPVLSGGGDDPKWQQKLKFTPTDFRVNAGHRIDQFDWSIAGRFSGSDPNILSELTWKDLEIYQLELGADVLLGDCWQPHCEYLLRGEAGFGAIVEGQNRDSDYAGDDRTLEFSRSNNSADGGDVRDFSIAAGLRFNSRDRRWALTPMVGYSYHELNLEMTDGYQTVSDQVIADDFFNQSTLLPPVGPFAETLDSSYDAKWWGPWLGLELAFAPDEDWTLKGSFEYHFADYESRANWNLRQDLAHPVSFRHWAEGAGLIYGLELNREIGSGWLYSLSAAYQTWQTDAGIDNTYLASGDISGTRLNRVNWESIALMLGVVRRF